MLSRNTTGIARVWSATNRAATGVTARIVWRDCYKLCCCYSKVVYVSAGDIAKFEAEISPFNPTFFA